VNANVRHVHYQRWADQEWHHIEPLTPRGRRGGGNCTVNVREVVNGVMYVLSTGCQAAWPSEGGVDKPGPDFPRRRRGYQAEPRD